MVLSKNQRMLVGAGMLLVGIIVFGMIYMKYMAPRLEGFRSFDFPEHDIIAIQKANLTASPGSGFGTGSYFNIFLKNKVKHETLASLPNPQGGFGIDGKKELAFYKVWLVDKKSGDALALGDMVRVPDGVYKLEVESDNPEIFNKFNMVAITYERDNNSGKPGQILLKGGLRSTSGVLCA